VIVRLARRVALAALPFALGACTLVGGVQPAPSPVGMPERAPVAGPAPPMASASARSPDRAAASPADVVAAGVVDVALESIGSPYEWGGTDANGFDCSGLIQFAYGAYGIRVPRTSAAQMRAGQRVEPVPGLLRPGDVLGFSDGRSGKTSHVGLYIGGDDFIHSGSSGVRVSNLRNPYWRQTLVAARRIVEREATPAL
jgi:cell wall-associated NlpC family hydrolase